MSVSKHHLLTGRVSEGYYLSSHRSRTLENILSAGVFIKGWTIVWFDIIWTMLFFRIKPLTYNVCCVLNY